MSIHLDEKDLLNAQQMEVAVNGPDGATFLILCHGVIHLGCAARETYTFLVGPTLSRRQFVSVIASGALSGLDLHGGYGAEDPAEATLPSLILIEAHYDEDARRVRIILRVSFARPIHNLAVSYSVNLLAELPRS